RLPAAWKACRDSFPTIAEAFEQASGRDRRKVLAGRGMAAAMTALCRSRALCAQLENNVLSGLTALDDQDLQNPALFAGHTRFRQLAESLTLTGKPYLHRYRDLFDPRAPAIR